MDNADSKEPAQAPPASPSPEPIYPLESIVRPLDLPALFSRPAPLEIELGCGDGSFLADYAAAHPERNFLGVERLLGRLRKASRKVHRRGLSTVRLVRIEAAYFLEYLLPPESADALHVYFPDPWPKRKHWKNRLVDERFPDLAARVLPPGGRVHFRTDDDAYIQQMLAVFAGHPAFTPLETASDPRDWLTDFERDFHARGILTRHASYERRPQAAE